MGAKCEVSSEIIRLADCNLPVGPSFKESDDDEWPAIVRKIKASDLVLFAIALQTMGTIMMVLTWMGFTLPPECAALLGLARLDFHHLKIGRNGS